MNDLLHEYHDRLGDALASQNRLAAVEKLHAEMAQRIAALEPMAQPSIFPRGEHAPLFTLPEDPDDQHLNCVDCNRHPAESGRASWQPCDHCGKPVCDSCYWTDTNNDGHFCSSECAFGTDPEQP